MDLESSTAELASRTGDIVEALTALAVTYSFSVIGAIIILVVGWVVAGLAQRAAYSAMGRMRHVEQTLRSFLSKIIRYAILIFVGVTVLAQFGVQTASIIAALGAIGLAIGLALQGTLQNIAAGIMLLFLRPFRAGEYIETTDIAGTIEEIGLFATELKTIDGLFVLAPNSTLWNTPITNFSRHPNRRYDLVVGVGYDDDLELAKATLLELAADENRVLDDPAPQAFISALADSSVAVTLRYWTSTPDHLQTKFAMTQKAKQAFDRQGISIPFPQQEVRYIMPDELQQASTSKADEAQTSASPTRRAIPSPASGEPATAYPGSSSEGPSGPSQGN